MKSFKDKVAVVTGAGSGIGRALALKLASEGCHLAISDVKEDTLAETMNMLSSSGVKVLDTVLDVSDKKAMQKYPEKVIDFFGKVNLVINNAGVGLSATVEEESIEDIEWMMSINFWGVVYGTKFFLPHLRKVDEAHIANVSSVFGMIGVPTQSAYNAAKFAVRGFTESLKYELKDTSIGVSCIHPGGIRTNIAASARYKTQWQGQSHSQAAQQFQQIARTTPDEAAEVIMKGIRKKDDRILIGLDAHLIDWVQRALPENYGIMFNMFAP